MVHENAELLAREQAIDPTPFPTSAHLFDPKNLDDLPAMSGVMGVLCSLGVDPAQGLQMDPSEQRQKAARRISFTPVINVIIPDRRAKDPNELSRDLIYLVQQRLEHKFER
jgi:hypothetical protein